MRNRIKTFYLYLTVFSTGAAVLMIEILGTRVLSPFYGSTIFAWSSLIIVTLGAIALGYFASGKLVDKYPHQTSLFTVVGISALLMFLPMKIDQWILPLTDGFGVEWGPLAAAAMLFAAPSFFLGMAGPMVVRLSSTDVAHSGRTAGTVFAVATLGSIMGGLLAGFFLMPHLRLTDIFQGTGLALFGLAAAGFLFFGKSVSGSLFAIFIFAFVLAAIAFFFPKYEYGDTYTFKLYHQEQSHYGDLKVMSVGGFYCLALNGFTQSCVDEAGGAAFSNVPAMTGVVNDRFREVAVPDSFRVLVLGVGAGDMLKAFSPAIKIDAVEIDPQVLGLARQYFNLAQAAHQNILVDDGRRFLRLTKEVYDFIVFDAYAGGQLPAHFLSLEAFRLFADKLKPDGALVMNIGARPSADDHLFMSIMRTAREVFPSVAVYATDPDDKDYLQGMILHASRGFGRPPVFEFYKPLAFSSAELAHGTTITDDYWPLDFAAADTFLRFRDKMRTFGGHRPFFSI